jgi:hypothetical protein
MAATVGGSNGGGCGGGSGVIDWRDMNSSLSSSMWCLHETRMYSDVVFKVGKMPRIEWIEGHRVIVMSRSEVFATMLEQRWTTNQSDKVEIDLTSDDEITPVSFRIFIRVICIISRFDSFEETLFIIVLL